MIGKEINLGSPKQLQVVLFDELGMPKTKRTKTGYTTDADALQSLYVKTEHPFLEALLRHRDVDPAAADRRGAAQDGRRRRPHPHDVQPDDRGHRPAVLDRPQPAEHPDPHRGGPPDPRGRSSSATGYESPDDRRLQPDRDADHGAPVRGRRADRGVPLRRRLPLGHRRRGSSAVEPDEVTAAMRAKIKAMNYGLAYGLSAFGLGQQLRIDAGRGARADGRVLRDASAASATTSRERRRRGPRAPATPRRSWAGAATCPT